MIRITGHPQLQRDHEVVIESVALNTKEDANVRYTDKFCRDACSYDHSYLCCRFNRLSFSNTQRRDGWLFASLSFFRERCSSGRSRPSALKVLASHQLMNKPFSNRNG